MRILLRKVLDFANSLNFVLSDEQTETAMRKVIKDYQSFGLLDKNLKEEEIVEKFWKPMD
jgi:NMT1/THI5 domain protein